MGLFRRDVVVPSDLTAPPHTAALVRAPAGQTAILPTQDPRRLGGHRPDLTEHQQWPFVAYSLVQAATGWTVPAARQAIDELDVGKFGNASLMMEETLRDDAVFHGYRTRQMGFLSAPERIMPAHGKAHRPSLLLQAYRNTVFPPGVWQDIHRFLLFFRFAICQIVWLKVPNPDGSPPFWFIPQLKPWHPGHIWYQQTYTTEGGDLAGGCFVVNTLDEGPIELRDKRREGGRNDAPGGGRFVLFSPGGALLPWRSALIRAVWRPWMRRSYTQRDHARYEERHGLPILKIRYPSYWGGESKEFQAFENSVANLGSGGVINCPQDASAPGPNGAGIDLDLLEAKAQTWGSFVASKTEEDNDIYTVFLAQSLTTAAGENGGSHAAVKGLLRVPDELRRDDALATGDVQMEWFDDPTYGQRWRLIPGSGPLRDQMTRYFAYYNFGDPDLAPYIYRDATPPDDRLLAEQIRKERATTIKTAAEGLKALKEALSDPRMVHERVYLEQFAVPVLSEEELKALPPAAAPSGDEGGGSADEDPEIEEDGESAAA